MFKKNETFDNNQSMFLKTIRRQSIVISRAIHYIEAMGIDGNTPIVRSRKNYKPRIYFISATAVFLALVGSLSYKPAKSAFKVWQAGSHLEQAKNLAKVKN